AAIASARLGGTEQGVVLAGRIRRLVRDEPGVINTGGTMVIGGSSIVIPRNLIMDLPATRLTLEELFEQAPEPHRSRGVSGMTIEDGPPCNEWFATVHANRVGDVIIAGKVDLVKRPEAVEGIITSI